jgi:putative peptide zinc metalloprotease protein
MIRRLALLLAALAFVFGAPGHAAAEDAGGDNSAVAINTKDDSSLFKFAFSLKKVLGEVVDNQNAAVAYASCERCQTTAIAIQIVLVSGSPSTVVPENYALSINENCTLCNTFSAAFQFVIGVDDPSVGFTVEGHRQLLEILQEFKALKDEQYTLEEFHAKMQELGQRLRTLLNTQLVSRRSEPTVADGEEADTVETERPAPPQAPAETTTDSDTTATTDGETTVETTATTTTESTATTTESVPTETTPPPTTTP